MPFQWLIKIGKSAPATFSPNPLNAAVGDEIVWSNNDSQPHWPGLVQSNGQINTTFFMPNQIAPNSTSTTFIPSAAGPLPYRCSLHPNESGTIQVSAVGAQATPPARKAAPKAKPKTKAKTRTKAKKKSKK